MLVSSRMVVMLWLIALCHGRLSRKGSHTFETGGMLKLGCCWTFSDSYTLFSIFKTKTSYFSFHSLHSIIFSSINRMYVSICASFPSS